MFSKYKLERMPLWKPYDHTIDFMEGAKLPKPAKVYLLSLAEKCFFEQSSIKYLGVIILENKVQMDEEKLLGVLE